jgi:TolB-like protein
MKLQRFLTLALMVLFCLQIGSHAQDIDSELSAMTEKLAASIKANGNKKVTVVDFTDLDGGSSELGRYIAEQLTVNLVMAKRDFSVLDRANLKKILAEHNLTAQGLVDPANAKQLGQFAGVDALILGTITPRGTKISLTAKIITTDTAEIIGAAKGDFPEDATVQGLISQSAAGAPANDSNENSSNTPPKVAPAFVKKFTSRPIRVEGVSMNIVDGSDYLLTVNLVNYSPNKDVYVAMLADYFVQGTILPLVGGPRLKSNVTDPDGAEYNASLDGVFGIGVAGGTVDRINGRPSLIKAGESVSATVKFFPGPGHSASPGTCRVQLSVLFLDRSGNGRFINPGAGAVMGTIQAN